MTFIVDKDRTVLLFGKHCMEKGYLRETVPNFLSWLVSTVQGRKVVEDAVCESAEYRSSEQDAAEITNLISGQTKPLDIEQEYGLHCHMSGHSADLLGFVPWLVHRSVGWMVLDSIAVVASRREKESVEEV